MTSVHHFAIYDTATGEVKRAGRSGNPRIADIQKLGDGEAVYKGKINPAETYLPDGVPTPKPPQAVTIPPDDIKRLAGRLLSYTDWYVTRRADTGEEIPEAISVYRQAVRDVSGALEAQDPIPADYRDPKHWPDPVE